VIGFVNIPRILKSKCETIARSLKSIPVLGYINVLSTTSNFVVCQPGKSSISKTDPSLAVLIVVKSDLGAFAPSSIY
jgi:hypothetical protein